ncbi:MAG: cohesin domain-containing protein, partial [bacterium]|nr:cohesin domain-containing protein [bacterium]
DTDKQVIKLNEWQHIAVTRRVIGNDVTISIYWNGTLIKEATNPWGLATTNNQEMWINKDPYMAAYTNQGLFKGLMDDLVIYNRALSAAEVQTLVQEPFPSKTSPADDLALHADTSASDNGWGGGASKSDLTDGIRTYDGEWARGLAFLKGWHQVTIDFGKTITYDRVTAWWHAGSAESPYFPQAYRIENWNGTSWVEIFSTTNPATCLKYPNATPNVDWWYYWSSPTENTFTPVTGSKVRLWSYPKDGEVMAGYHVWLYEVEVYNDAGSVPLLDVSTTSLPSGTVNTSYQSTLTATGGTPPYKWSFSDSLPAGLSLSEGGLISGTPIQLGSFTFTAQVTDYAGISVSKELSIYIAATPITPVFVSPQGIGSEFWVDIQAGDEGSPVSSLIGVAFRLNYDTALLDVVAPYAANIANGDLLGSDVVFMPNVDDDAGYVDIGVCRKNDTVGVTGYGTIARIKFRVNPDAVATTTCFSISNLAITGAAASKLYPQKGCLAIVKLPETPTLISPDDGVLTVSTALDYQWNTVDGANYYIFELSNNASFSSIGFSGTTTLSIYNPGVSLPDDTYYWRVRAVNDAGLMGAWSNVRSVRVTTVVFKPIVTTTQLAGADFWVDVDATKTVNVVPTYYPLNNLFGVNFSLFYDRADILEPIAVEAGSFFDLSGTATLLLWSVVENTVSGQGRIDIAMTHKAGHTGVSGYGQIVRVKFKTASGTSATGIKLQTTDTGYPITAYNPDSDIINIAGAYSLLDISKPIDVWPGDTNNDGNVNTADIFPLALYFNQTGPVRPTASLSWTGQPMPCPWSPIEMSYADANGDGIINAMDILAVGVNYGKTHIVSSGSGFAPALLDKEIDHVKYLEAYRAMYQMLEANGVHIQGAPELKQALVAAIETGVIKQEVEAKPEESILLQSYPNPFNPECWIPFELSEKANVVIRIYNISGQLVKTLDLGEKEAGNYTIQSRAAYWNGRNDEGDEIASGVYFYQMQTGSKVMTKRAVVLK